MVIEVGVGHGGSLAMWRDFGPNPRIVGIDLNPQAVEMREERFEIFVGDQASPKLWEEVRAAVPTPDILIDDGGHRMEEQIATFREMYPHLAADGGLPLRGHTPRTCPPTAAASVIAHRSSSSQSR